MGRVGHACINKEFHKTRLRLGSTDRPCQCGAIITNEDVEATGVWRDVDASVRENGLREWSVLLFIR